MPPPSEQPYLNPEDHNRDANNEDTNSEDDNLGSEVNRTRTVTQVRHYSGPIPPSDEFARYKEIYPGSADRLFSMAEKEQDATVKFRYVSLAATTVVAVASIIAIALILTTNPESLVLVALAIAYALPSITDFLRGIVESQLSRKERELELQIRKDNHELDMVEARKRLGLGSGSTDTVTQRTRRLEASAESPDELESNR